jgi:hypothetical protein
MNSSDIKVIRHKDTGAKRFGYWIFFKDTRGSQIYSGKRGRKDLINFFENSFGTIGEKWSYQKLDIDKFIIKFDQEKDFIFFLLKSS